MTLKETWDKAIELLPFKGKAKKAMEENISKAESHVFTYKLEQGQIVNTKQISLIITLSPWSAAGSKPVVNFTENEAGEKLIEIRFKALSKRKAKLVEQSIANYMNTSKT
jgi:hypothetical protein